MVLVRVIRVDYREVWMFNLKIRIMKRVVRYPRDGVLDRVKFVYSPSEFAQGRVEAEVREFAGGYPYSSRVVVVGGQLEVRVTLYYTALAYMLDVLRTGLWRADGDPGCRNRMLCYMLN